MKRQAFQHPELRDANDNIIQEGTYGKTSPLVNSTNDGVLDYINNNLEALYDAQTAADTSISTETLTVSGKTTTGTLEASSATVSGQTTTGTLAAGDTTVTGTVKTSGLTVTGETSVPTANAGNSSKAIANTEFVAKSLASLVDSAPEQLNTLNELAKALGNDANFSATITAELAKKLNSAEAESTYATKTEAGVPYQIKRNTAYKVGDVLTSPSLPPGCVIVVTQAGTTGSTEPDWATIKSNMGG